LRTIAFTLIVNNITPSPSSFLLYTRTLRSAHYLITASTICPRHPRNFACAPRPKLRLGT